MRKVRADEILQLTKRVVQVAIPYSVYRGQVHYKNMAKHCARR